MAKVIGDTIRMAVPSGCRSVDIGRTRYEAQDGYVTIDGPHAAALKPMADCLPGRHWSLAGSASPELRCLSCHRSRLALFGSVCSWCGGLCVEAEA